MKRKIYYLITRPIYWWGCIWYDKNYLKGIYFKNGYLSKGWFWILKYWFPQKILGYAREVPFPIPRGVKYGNPKNIIFDPNDIVSMQTHGCYFQALNAKIIFGSGVKIAPNCGFITTNHDVNDLNSHTEGKEIKIGKNCWFGMNCIVLPGVELGNNTIVGAGSVVTKSFKEGNCIIAGNPAKVIRKLDE